MDETKNYINEIKLLGNNIKHVHLKDRNNKGKNVLLGKGNVNFKHIFKSLKKINYKGYFTIESTREKNAVSSLIKNRRYLFKCLKTIN